MFTRLRAAYAVLMGRILIPTDGCARCLERDRTIDRLEGEVRYWRGREERTADALLHAKGVMGRVATPPAQKSDTGMALLARGITVTEFDSTKSKQPGQGAMTGGDREH